MKTSSRVLVLALVVISGLMSCTSKTGHTVSGLEILLDSLKSEYAPDSRLALWNVHVTQEDGISLEGSIGQPEAFDLIEKALENDFPGVENKLELLAGPLDMQVNALVNNSVIHLRREPSSKTEMVTQALLGTPVRILKEDRGKRLVQVADGYLGWVNTPEVQELDDASLAAYRDSEKIIYMRQYGFAYSQPDEQSLPVSDLVIGNILAVEGESAAFLQVRYPDGRLAYVLKEEVLPLLDVFNRKPTGEDLVATALNYMGIPYLWGGASSKNIDCSGLISNVYYLNGIQLPRDADMQSHLGRELTTTWDASVLEAGDLLFFGKKATGEQKERITHVAMYIGGGEFIHSAGFRERVSVNHMDSSAENYIESYPDIFVRAVRVLGEEGGDFRPLPENEFYKAILTEKR